MKPAPLQQHARRLYTFKRYRHTTRSITRHFFVYTRMMAHKWLDNAATLKYLTAKHLDPLKYAAWPIIALFHIISWAQYLSILLFPCFILLYSLLLLTRFILAYISIAILTITTFAFRKINHIALCCPQCYKTFSLPLYLCPTCGHENAQLLPNTYGVLSHRCRACPTHLPTLDYLGRKRLKSICPSCQFPLMQDIAQGPTYHIALVGAPASGKTSYLVTALQALKFTCAKRLHSSLTITDSGQADYLASQLSQLRAGQDVETTSAIAPPAYTVKIQMPKRHLPAFAYLYDPAGTAFASSRSVSEQHYYRTIDAIILTIDPLTLPGFQQTAPQPTAASAYTGHVDSIQAYERMMQVIETTSGLRKRGRYNQPVAVIVTKIDLLQLHNRIGLPAARALKQRTPAIPSEADALHLLVRDFLSKHGLDNFVRDLELHFTHVRYFSSSIRTPIDHPDRTPATIPSRIPDLVSTTSPCTPDPLLWFFTHWKLFPKTP